MGSGRYTISFSIKAVHTNDGKPLYYANFEVQQKKTLGRSTDHVHVMNFLLKEMEYKFD